MDTTIINNIFRPVYGMLVQGVARLTPEWEQLQKLTNFEQLSPRSVNWPVELTLGGGAAFTSEGGSTARATSSSPVEAQDTWTHLTGRFEASYDAMDAENNSKFARQQIVKQLKYQAKDKLRAFKRAVAVNFYGHNTGHLFLAEGTASNPSGTQTKVRLKDLYGETGLTFDRIRDYITVDQDFVNVHSGTTSTIRGGGVVVAIDEASLDITLDSSSDFSGAVTAGDAIIMANQVKPGSADDQDLWMNGLLDITRATTLHNISSSAQPDWVAGVDESSYGQVLSGQDLYQWFNQLSERSDHAVEWAYTTIEVIAQAGGPELDQRRYGADSDTLNLGFKEINSMGVKLEARQYVPTAFLFIGSNSALRKLSPDEGGPKDLVESGDRMGSFQQYENTLGFYKDQVFRGQLTAVSRLGVGVVSGITDS